MKLDENRELWIKRVEEHKSSGLSQKVWCEENYIWYNKNHTVRKLKNPA